MSLDELLPELNLPQRQMLADDIHTALRAALVSNSIAPGKKLNLDALARRMSVSNTPIRQALSRLEAEGLVIRQPNRGFIASPLLDWTTVRDMYESRILLEPATAERAAGRVTNDDLTTLMAYLDSAEMAVEDDVDDSQAISRNVASDESFHEHIATMAGNRVIVEQLQRLNVRARSYRSTYSWPEAASLTHKEHRAIYDAVAKHNGGAAHDAMLAHLSAASERMRRAFD